MKRRVITLLMVIFFTNHALINYANENKGIDYSKNTNWLSLPSSNSQKTDIFYLYPTAWNKVKKNEPNICEINNPIMLKNTKRSLKFLASEFHTLGNVYSPYYRQADSGYLSTLTFEQQDEFLTGIPKSDIFAAFDYYIKNYNQGRPYILVSHSQGSMLMLELLSKYMKENPRIYEKMVAAYVIGCSVTKDYLEKNPHLKFAQGPNDTGVIISYNTEAPEIKGTNPILRPNAISINPISWTIEETPATTEKNLGSIVFNKLGFTKTVKNYADACVNKNRGTVICTSVNSKKLCKMSKRFPQGVYHCFDYAFYYYNLKENAKNRANIFLKNHSEQTQLLNKI